MGECQQPQDGSARTHGVTSINEAREASSADRGADRGADPGVAIGPGRDGQGIATAQWAAPLIYPSWRALIRTSHQGRGPQGWEAWLPTEHIWGSGHTEAEALGNLLRWHDQEVMRALATRLGAVAPTEASSPPPAQLSALATPAVPTAPALPEEEPD